MVVVVVGVGGQISNWICGSVHLELHGNKKKGGRGFSGRQPCVLLTE